MMIQYVQLKRYIYNDLTCVSDCTADNTHSDTRVVNIPNCTSWHSHLQDIGAGTRLSQPVKRYELYRID